MGVTVPSIVSIIPTPFFDRPYLERAIRSWFRAEPAANDRLLLVGDSHEHPDVPVELEALADRFNADDADTGRAFTRVCTISHDAGRHNWGHSQCNAGIALIKREMPDAFIAWMDDDDVFAPRAFFAVHNDIARFGERVYLYRFLTHYRMVVWTNSELHEGHISGQCCVAPAKWCAEFGERYEGDFDFIRQTVESGGGEDRIMWRETCLGIARPHAG